jgi:hypothetical protein
MRLTLQRVRLLVGDHIEWMLLLARTKVPIRAFFISVRD